MDDATAAAYRAMGYIRRQTKGRPLYSEAEAAGVEHQDGTVQRVQPDSLTFLGSKELFDQYSWLEDK